MVSSTPAAFADHSEITIVTSDDSGFNMDCGTDCYDPSTVTVEVGAHVTFSNPVGFHTFTAGTVENNVGTPSGEFDVTLAAEETAEWIPETAGEIPYYCTFHPWMLGTIIVEEGVDEEAEAQAAAEELMVTITDSVVDDGTQVELDFSELHVNYEITATQNGETILQETSHAMDHKTSHMIDAVGSDDSPIVIEIVSLSGEGDDWNGPTGTVATSQVVPEFGTIAMMILAVAIISIVAVTAKTRVVPRF